MSEREQFVPLADCFCGRRRILENGEIRFKDEDDDYGFPCPECGAQGDKPEGTGVLDPSTGFELVVWEEIDRWAFGVADDLGSREEYGEAFTKRRAIEAAVAAAIEDSEL